MKWNYVKPLASQSSLKEFEQIVQYRFPEDFRKCVQQYNGGRPEQRVFDTDKGTDRMITSLLSFNQQDKENVWDLWEWGKEDLQDRYVPFGIDPFGNLLAFDVKTNDVMFLDHETGTVEKAASNFTEFLEKLHE